MSFVSFAFLILFLVVVAGRVVIGRNSNDPKFQLFLLLASLIFYAWHVIPYILLLLLSVSIDYYVGLALQESTDPKRRKLLLLASLGTNLGLLCLFKYADFGLASAEAVLAWCGVDAKLWRLDLVLPMGISFYTFQSLSYSIDVYRGQLKAISHFRNFFLYVAFFPQLVAGPIVRARDFLYQLERRRKLRWVSFSQGLFLVVRGFFLKMVIADNLGRYVDAHWSEAAGPQGHASLSFLVTLLFSAQIFADFAGYSSIARGLAYMMGYRLPINFRSPYISASFREFWSRWHISLSTWLRDYLYIPLGGNRLGSRRTYVNLMLVMLLGGLWHGAAWTFVIWGALHGGALALERWLGTHLLKGLTGAVYAWLVQLFVLVTWVFFRAQSSGEAFGILGNLGLWKDQALNQEAWVAIAFLLPVALMHLRTYLVDNKKLGPCTPVEKAVYTGLMFYAIMTLYARTTMFLYFQF